MSTKLISAATLDILASYLSVNSTVSSIESMLAAEDIFLSEDADTERPMSGVRKHSFYNRVSSLDLEDYSDARKLVKFIERILDLGSEEYLRPLINSLKRDGWEYLDGALTRATPEIRLPARQASLLSMEVISVHKRRIEENIEADPSLAIGSAKELLESVCKHILDDNGIRHDDIDDIGRLVKATRDALNLNKENFPDPAKAADILGRIIGGMGSTVEGLTRLRNEFGSGHGHLRTSPVKPRHARLAVSAAISLVVFFAETHDVRRKSVSK